ncbi:acetyltransferase [Nemania abortiva]|nr:acetyltransferase [Nemania abortiva]
MAFIRLYEDSDFDACAHICIATLPPTLASSPAAAKLSPYLWTHPYTFLSPSTCHVLDDGTGKAVGYCIGCPDVHAFVADYQRYVTAILSRDVPMPDFSVREPWIVEDATATTVNPLALAQNAYRADWMLLEHKSAVTTWWRATMHIDLLPEWQGRGWGRRLIERFVDSVRGSGLDYGEGEHIGVAGENSKVVPFYERVGFRVVEGGEREGNIWMVRDIEKV